MNNNPIVPNEAEESAFSAFLKKYRAQVLVGALAFLLIIGLILSIVWLVKATNVTYGEITETPFFDYEATNPTDFMPDFDLGKFKDLTIGGKGEKIEVNVDEDYVTDYINVNILLAQKKATNNGLAMRSVAIDYADVVAFYVLDLTKDGEKVLPDEFGLTYSQLTLTVGGLYYGKDFDDKLMGLIPASSSLDMRYSGTFTAADTVSATYTVKIKDEDKVAYSLSGARLELSTLDADLKNAILTASNGTIGKLFTFEYEEDVDDDGELDAVVYEMTVNAIADEKAISITFTFPEDYFAENLGEEYTALNGQTVTMRVVLSYAVAYEAYTVETLLSQDLTTATGDSKALEEAKAAAKLLSITDETKIKTKDTVLAALREELSAGLAAALDEEKESVELSLIGNAYMKLVFASLPEAEIEAYRQYWALYYFEAFCDAGLYTDMTFDGFASVAMGFVAAEDGSGAQNFDEYIIESAEYNIKQNLVVAWLYKAAGLNTAENEQKIKDGFAEYLKNTYGTDKEADLKNAGYDMDVVYKDYHLQAIGEYVNEWMLKNNTIDYTLEIEE